MVFWSETEEARTSCPRRYESSARQSEESPNQILHDFNLVRFTSTVEISASAMREGARGAILRHSLVARASSC